ETWNEDPRPVCVDQARRTDPGLHRQILPTNQPNGTLARERHEREVQRITAPRPHANTRPSPTPQTPPDPASPSSPPGAPPRPSPASDPRSPLHADGKINLSERVPTDAASRTPETQSVRRVSGGAQANGPCVVDTMHSASTLHQPDAAVCRS